MKFETHDAYWEDIMANRRMPLDDEVTRLTSALYGFLYRHNEYSRVANREYDIMDPIEFWDSKRPYGNKNNDMAIAYNLGWDYKRLMVTSILPEFVKVETQKLHALVKEEIIKQEEFITKIKNKQI